MAIINCPECGREVSDKALTCPHCGNPINLKTEIPVRFTRRSKFNGGALKFVVYVDAMMVGKVGNGESFTVKLMQGNHQIDVEAVNPLGNAQQEKSCAFEIPSDAKEVSVELATGFMGISVDVTTTR